METLRGIVVVLHLVGFALIFGSWAVEAFSKRMQVTRPMQWGLVVALLTGAALAAPWGMTGELNHMKIGIKLAVLLVIGALMGIGGARQRRNGKVAAPLFWLIGILTLANATIAILV